MLNIGGNGKTIREQIDIEGECIWNALKGSVSRVVKRVDVILRNMGLKICELARNEVLLSDYMEGSTGCQSSKKISREKMELRNLE